MSILDIRPNLDASVEALFKSGADRMGPQGARDTLEEHFSTFIECFGHYVYFCGEHGEDFSANLKAMLSDALDDAFGPSIKEAEFDSPIGHNSRQRSHGTYNSRQQGLLPVHGANLR